MGDVDWALVRDMAWRKHFEAKERWSKIMPQASEELRAKWGGEMGVGDDKAIAYLEAHGWTMVENGLWKRPTDRPASELGHDEWEALTFLRDEWDHDYILPSDDAD